MAWFIGYAIGIAVVAVVVLLLVVLIKLAQRIAARGEEIVDALEAARDNSAPLWAVHDVNQTLERITHGAAAARLALEEERGGR